MKLGELIPRVTKAYEDFEFHAIFHALNNFCSVDMSAVYLDILKDRLYTFHKDSPLRRSSQTVLLEIVVALTKLMAPVLSFTAEEIWQTFPGGKADAKASSVHLASFPSCESKWIDHDLEHRWDDLLNVRTIVQGRLEEKRREKLIGSSLEAKVILHASKSSPAMYDVLKPYEAFLPSLFIVSQVELRGVDHVPELLMRDLGDGFGVEVIKVPAQKCERCWNYREAVGMDKEHPTLCERCLEAIRG
jgi:isoleucyl-tRNA synthetase